MHGWRRYWFADGGRFATAAVRIGIACAVLLTLRRLATLSTVDLTGTGDVYRPVGLWMLFGHHAPPEAIVTALWALAWTSTAAMLLGIASRAATAVSLVTSLALVSLSYASALSWSHSYNVVFLAQLAFLGARGSDAWSLDALHRRRRGLPPLDAPGGYQWSIRLVQLAVAMMFAGAAFHKLLGGQFTLRWALSDNLRNQLLIHYDLAGLPRTAVASWLMDDVWRFRTAALLNLASQAVPILACVFVTRPAVRAVAGAFFVIETIGLGLVVGLWNPHWLPLAAVFVDWDRLLRRMPAPRPGPARIGAATNAFIATFVALVAATSLVPGLDRRLNLYPFSSFPMFASIRARPPYDQHLAYAVAGDRYEVLADRPPDRDQQRWFDDQHRRVYAIRDPEDLHRRLAALLAQARTRYPELGIHGIRHRVALFQAPAYPAPAHLESQPIAILGEIDEDGTFRTALGKVDGPALAFAPRGLPTPPTRLVYFPADATSPRDLPARTTPTGYDLELPADPPAYIAAIIDDQCWLIASP